LRHNPIIVDQRHNKSLDRSARSESLNVPPVPFARPVMQSVMPRLPVQPVSLRRHANPSPLEFGSALVDCQLVASSIRALICNLSRSIAITSTWHALGRQYLDYHLCFHFFPIASLLCRGGVWVGRGITSACSGGREASFASFYECGSRPR
jgi:hypothetical protein